MEEIWVKVQDAEYYEVSNMGNVRSVDRILPNSSNPLHNKMVYKGRVLKPSINGAGYFRVSLKLGSKKIKSKEARIHQLVARNFIPNPENKEQVNHKNGIKIDNRVDNLEWVTRRENTLHAIDNNLAALKLDKFDYIHIRLLKEKEIKVSEIAHIFDVNVSHVRNILNNKTYR